jgi:type VI secretion system secreted protein VgrG
VVFVAAAVLVTPWSAASAATVQLATATAYSVLAGTTVTNTGPSVLNQNVGVAPGTAITGFPPGTVVTGVMDSANAVSLQGQADLTAAYIDAAGRPITATEPADLTNLHLPPGVYEGPAHGAISLSGPLVLDGGGDFGAVFIFQTHETLITASSSTVTLINGAQECNVFWQVGSSATLGTNSVFAGNIMALTSISVQTGVTVHGRALARNGAVTLDNDVFTTPTCALADSTTTTEAGTGGTTPGETTPGETATTEAESTDTTEAATTGTPRIRLPDTGAPVKAPLLLAGAFVTFGVAAVYLARRNSPSEG